ncbi:MAG: hypothetical protein ABI663_07450 [Chryseolinea sp.]
MLRIWNEKCFRKKYFGILWVFEYSRWRKLSELAVQNLNITESHIYNVEIAWSKDRKGIMCSPELNGVTNAGGCIEVVTPPKFPKGIPGIWSPEHLFTAAVCSCLMTTILAVAENSKFNFV